MLAYQDAVSELVLSSTLVALAACHAPPRTSLLHLRMRADFRRWHFCRVWTVDCVPYSSSISSILTYALKQLDNAADVAHASTSLQAIQLGALFTGLGFL